MSKTNRKSILSGLDDPRPSLLGMIRKYGLGLAVLLAVLGLGSFFLSGTSDNTRKQTFISLELPPPPQATATPINPSTSAASPPAIPDDQE
ncbi:MAG: hypothetical protein HQL76_16400 [Magnetococcales bacterium]|nr:hypothetical protein [Magnetococcales bacterium]